MVQRTSHSSLIPPIGWTLFTLTSINMSYSLALCNHFQGDGSTGDRLEEEEEGESQPETS